MIAWVLEDHLCKACGGRILRSHSGTGMTPGGNPIYKCADCGTNRADMGPQKLCWCGFTHKLQSATAYRCVSYALLKDYPDLIAAFRSCGCDPERGGEVGIVIEKDLYRIINATKK